MMSPSGSQKIMITLGVSKLKDKQFVYMPRTKNGWLVVLGLTALEDSISEYIGPSLREREKEERNDRREKNVQTTPTRMYCKHSRPLPYYKSNYIVGRPGTESLPNILTHV